MVQGRVQGQQDGRAGGVNDWGEDGERPISDDYVHGWAKLSTVIEGKFVQGEYVEHKAPETFDTWACARGKHGGSRSFNSSGRSDVGSLSKSLSCLSVSDGTDVGGSKNAHSVVSDVSSVRIKQAARRNRQRTDTSGLRRGFLT